MIVHDGARVEKIYLFIKGKNLGLVLINKLDQLCKYILNIKIKKIEKFKLEINKKNFFNQKVYPGESILRILFLWVFHCYRKK